MKKLNVKYIIYSLIIPALIVTPIMVLGLKGYRINVSPSMPIGIWKVKGDTIETKKGDVVSFCIPKSQGRSLLSKDLWPGEMDHLLKSVVALKGDQVSLTDEYVAINNQTLPNTMTYRTDHLDLPLPYYPRGTYITSDDEFWLISTYHERSLDSRYFGPIRKNQIKAVMEPIWVWK